MQGTKKLFGSLLCNRNYGKRVLPGRRLLFSDSFNPFAHGNTTPFIDMLYRDWLKDRNSVFQCWDLFFQNSVQETSAPSLPMGASPLSQHYSVDGGSVSDKNIEDHLAVQQVIRSYQVRGHIVAKLDPLGICMVDRHVLSETEDSPPDDVKTRHKLTDVDMNKVFRLPKKITYIGGKEEALPLKEILRRLELIYCNHIGLEFMYLYSIKECEFIREKFETPNVMATAMNKEEKKKLNDRLIKTHQFEHFLANKWKSEKRFGVEGGDIFVPMLQQVIDTSASFGAESFVLGMAHRGRLNVLANVCQKPLAAIFSQFHSLKPDDEGSGDVKYHLGLTTEVLNEATQKKVTLSLVANPSHLELVNSVCQGKCRAEQFYKGDTKGTKVLTVLIHGDASFSGQGIVYECISMAYLPQYTTHGNIHIIINNQVGFTTDPRFSRSSRYCTDVAKVVNSPIFHVNGDDPEACIYATMVASEFRAKFKKDVVLDIVCYRRNGHNEADEPMFTQPLMYTKIRKLTSLSDAYSEKLVSEGVVTADHIKAEKEKYNKFAEDGLAEAKQKKTILYKEWLDSRWPGFFKKSAPLKYSTTGVPEDLIKYILEKFSAPPGGDFVHHKGIDRILNFRKGLLTKRQVDYAMAEACAFGSLLKEGIHVRLSGEDVERGTFSHRHHVLHHQTKDGVKYIALQNLWPEQAKYIVSNSSLCENGVLGFEHGYSLVNPMALVIWEAQFGDFFNCAQPVVDAYLSAGEAKWIRQSGLVLNLPHGMDGMGPEHSSARLERFLLMCTDDPDNPPPPDEDFAIKQLKNCNWIVTNCSTPANYFHVLRRQIKLPFRKVLINMSPKFLLRHPEARSSWDEMVGESSFQRLIPDKGPASKSPNDVKKHVFCSGKVYYDFDAVRKAKKMENIIALTRIDQLSPFPFDLVKIECGKYPTAALFWGQEEPKNQGAWLHVKPRFDSALGQQKHIKYIGRDYAAAPATGNKWQHLQEVKLLMADFTMT